MMATDPADIDEGYFNDLSRQPTTSSGKSPQDQHAACENGDEGDIPKTKRIACVICRKRKLKCDGSKPKCGTCARLGHNCAYDEIRRKSGPKRGYVKELEARLAQVETQLQTKASEKLKGAGQDKRQSAARQNNAPQAAFDTSDSMDMQNGIQYSTAEQSFDTPINKDAFVLPTSSMVPEMNPDLLPMPDMNLGLDDNFSWEMIGLGLEEPMPMQEAIDELTQMYFEKIHPAQPIIHKYRYHASMSLAPQARPPVCLRYIMWCHAAATTEKYMHHQDIFYRRARKYLELDEMKGQGEAFVSIAHAQCWVLVSSYEFKMMYFPRAWMSVGRATRMVLMIGLNRVDDVGLDVKQCLPPPRDWTEREERRRTFWMAYCVDRYASIGTGWPMSVDELDITTNLPANEDAYENSIPQSTPTLNEAMTQEQVSTLSPFAGAIYVTHFFGLNLIHLHRPESHDQDGNLQGRFWKRHRDMDNMLLNTSLSLPSQLRLPAGVRNPNTAFLNFALHTSTICLHQAAIFKAEKNQLSSAFIGQSRTRCIMAASEIASIMRLTSHLDVASMNPFIPFCLFVAARVFISYLKITPDDQEVKASLQFLLTAMAALRRKNPFSESCMIQLGFDIEGSHLESLLHNSDYSMLRTSKAAENAENIPFPEWRDSNDTSNNAPSTRSDSPRHSQYAFKSIELAAREACHTHPYVQNRKRIQGSTFRNVFPGKGWSQNFAEAPIGLNPLFDNSFFGTAVDSDMSNNQTQSRDGSAGQTPYSTTPFHPSSNTSYSPPQVQDEEPTMMHPTSMPPQSGFNTYHPSYAPPPGNFFVSPSVDQENNSVNVSVSSGMGSLTASCWDAPNGTTPAFSGTGMTPDGGWEKMMEGMVWDGKTGMSPMSGR